MLIAFCWGRENLSSGAQIGALAGAVIGGVIGAFAGNPILGAQLGLAVGGFIGGVVDPVDVKSPEAQIPEGIKDLFITSPAIGQMKPILFGTYRLPGQIIDATPKERHVMEVVVPIGNPPTNPKGKGGGPRTRTDIVVTYTITLAMALCEGPIHQILRIWSDLDLVYDSEVDLGRLRLLSFDSAASTKTVGAEDGSIGTAILYFGTETQEPSPILEEIHGVGEVPAYRGLAYVVMKDLDLGSAGRVPNFTFEVQRSSSPRGDIRDITFGDGVAFVIFNNIVSNGLGSVVVYDGKTWTTLNERVVGVRPIQIAYIERDGGLVGVLHRGPSNGDHVSTDTLQIFAGGRLLIPIDESPVELRTSLEKAANVSLGSNRLVASGVTSSSETLFFVNLDNISSVVFYNVSTGVLSGRHALGAGAVDMVWTPGVAPGAPRGFLYVLRENSTVVKLNIGTSAFVEVETITVGVNPSKIFLGVDGKIWVVNTGSNNVSHFTSISDYGTVATGPAPVAITQASDNYIWVASSTTGTLTRIHNTLYTTETFTIPRPAVSLSPSSDGAIWVATNSSFVYRVSPTGEVAIIRAPNGTFKIISGPDGYGYGISTSRQAIAIVNDGSATNVQGTEDGLACVVRYLCQKAGLRPEEIDVSGLDNTQVNMVLTQVQPVRSVLQTLQDVFRFGGVESSGVLRWTYDANSFEAAIIPEEALAVGENRVSSVSLGVGRVQERELPTQVSITYVDPSRNYESNVQTVQLTSGNIDSNSLAISVPVALNGVQAYRAAEVQLYTPWTYRERFEWTLSPMFLLLDPRDVIRVTARTIEYTVRLSELIRGFNWITQVRGVGFEKSIFTDTVVPTNLPSAGLIEVPVPGRLGILLVDAPPLMSTDVTLRFFIAAYNTQPLRRFTVAALFRSLDGGSTYALIGSSGLEATTGTVASPLGSANAFVFDDVNVVTVVLRSGTLSSATDLELYNFANQAMIGNELIQFGVATLVGPKTYELRHLLRGRKGTESFISTHVADEDFVLLNGIVTSNAVVYSSSIISLNLFYKTVDPVTTLAGASPFQKVLSGRSIKPWAPVLREALRDVPAAGDVTFRFLYRSRTMGELVNNSGISWDVTATKQFQIFIYQNSIYITKVRTIFVDASALAAEATMTGVYTAAQQIADFGATQSTIYYGVIEVGVGINGYESRGIA